MRILLVSSAFYPYPSGISEHTYYLAKGLANLGHTVKILTTNYPERWEDRKIEDIEVIRFGRVILLPLNKSFATLPFSFTMPAQVKRFLEEERFDIIHLHGCYPPEIGFWVLHFSHTVNCCTFHTVGFRGLPLPKISSLLFKRYIKKLSGKIAVSRVAKEWIAPAIPGEYRIIPNGVDIHRFSPSLHPRIKKDGRIILFVGRLDKRKGAEVAIRAFKRIKERFPEARLLIIGQGPREKALKGLVREMNLKDVLFLGYAPREELPFYYASGDVYVSPALGGEAFGIVLLEAMATGKPVVASDIAGYREVIKDGEDGLFFKTGESEDLAEKVITILKNEDLRQRLEKNARRRAEEYSWERIVKKVEEYYLELVAGFSQQVRDKRC